MRNEAITEEFSEFCNTFGAMPLRQIWRTTSQIHQRLSQVLSHCFCDVLPCRRILKLKGSGSTKHYIGTKTGKIKVDLQLPADLVCQHCVFQVRSALSPNGVCLPSTICMSYDPGTSFSASVSQARYTQYLRGTCVTSVVFALSR